MKTIITIKPLVMWAIERSDNMKIQGTEEDKNKRGTEYKTGEIDCDNFKDGTTQSVIYDRCLRCHRALKTKKAMRIGYGHICIAKMKQAAEERLNKQTHEEFGQHGEELNSNEDCSRGPFNTNAWEQQNPVK